VTEQPVLPAAPLAFAYHRAVAPMLWVLVALAGCELLVAHVLVAIWSHRAAVILSLLSVSGIVWLVWAIWSFKAMPVLVAPDRLTLRVGRIKRIEVPIGVVAGLRASWDGAAIKHRSLLNLALVAYPNIVIDLHEPVMTGGPLSRSIVAIAHRLDDPQAFAAALGAVLRARAQEAAFA
jgi:hypothetical protein